MDCEPADRSRLLNRPGTAARGNGDATRRLEATAAEIGGVHNIAASRVQFQYKRIDVARLEWLIRVSYREIGGLGVSGDVCAPISIDGNDLAVDSGRRSDHELALIGTAAADVGCVNKPGTVGGKLGNEQIIQATAVGRLECSGRYRKSSARLPGDENVSACVERDAPAGVEVIALIRGASQVGGEDQRTIAIELGHERIGDTTAEVRLQRV